MNKPRLDKDKYIAGLLHSARNDILDGRSEDAVKLFNELLVIHPEWADERLAGELSLIERLIYEQKLLKDSEYTRSFEMVYKYLKQMYMQDDLFDYDLSLNSDLPDRNKVWWCWLQGYDAAPDLVKRCYESLRILGRDVIVLDENNIWDYMELPDYIVMAYNEGIITKAHFSDLIRLELLTVRGGTWIDSTVYCTSNEELNDIIESSALFAYRAVRADNISKYATFDSWLIHNSKHSFILEDTKRMLFEYWKREKSLRHYFLFHIFVNIACERHPDEKRDIPIYSSEPCHVLQVELSREYDDHRYYQICGMSGIHKLTYRYDPSATEGDTFLNRILVS